jgi:hypothetical protein
VAFDVSDVESPPPVESTSLAEPLAGTPRAAVHRLRDLTRAGRLAAGAVAAAVLLAPVAAFVRFAPDWVAAGDNALIGLRVLDVGTSRTPLVGQPSTSGFYGGDEAHAFHPGATHFYLMAPFVRLLGLSPGMIVVSVLITGGSALLALWVIHRQLGPRVAVVAGVVLAAVMFTTGASSLLNPISSNIGGYPLLCSAVLVWSLLCGDDRLLPLTTVVVSFTAQQHLSLGPTMAVLALTAVGGLAVGWWRADAWGDHGERRRVARLLALSAGLGLLAWLGPLVQQVTGHPGNLTSLVTFASDSGRESVGLRVAVRQVAQALGWPPVLGDRNVSGYDLLEPVAARTWVGAVAVLAVLAAAGLRWWRTDPRRARLVVMAGVLIVCGLVNGSNVPLSTERGRIAFYHWVWPLALFTTLALLLLAGELLASLAERVRRLAPRAVASVAFGACLVAMVVPPVADTGLHRENNQPWRLGYYFPSSAFDSLTDQVMERRSQLRGPVLVTSMGEDLFDGTGLAVSLSLAEAGLDAVHPPTDRSYVDDDHLVDSRTVDQALLVVTDRLGQPAPSLPIPGRQIAHVRLNEQFDREAYDTLLAQTREATSVTYGPDLQRALDDLGDDERVMAEAVLDGLAGGAEDMLAQHGWVAFLADHPPESPALDPELLRRLADSLPDDGRGGGPALGLRVFLVTGDDLDTLLGR